METLLNATFEVVSFGAIIVLIVLGLGIIAGMMGILNFAHGEFVLLRAYISYLAFSFGLPVWVGISRHPSWCWRSASLSSALLSGASMPIPSSCYSMNRPKARRSAS
jgi:branched-subunit amino acid ABC-type transport system permease component